MQSYLRLSHCCCLKVFLAGWLQVGALWALPQLILKQRDALTELGLGRRVDVIDIIDDMNNLRRRVVPNRKWWYLRRLRIAPLTQRLCINAAAAVRQFSTVRHSHRAKHRWNKDDPPCNSQKAALPLLERRDSTRHDDDVGVFPRCPPVNLNPHTVYNV